MDTGLAASPDIHARRALMALCAKADAAELSAALDTLAPVPAAQDLRPVETGLVMVRGRIGGDGQRFNLGEATCVRAAVRLADGTTGFAYHLGRDAGKARTAAILDALAQQDGRRAAVEAALAPIGTRLADARARQARQAAATRVDFFTMVRGED